jgi:hypothetical protein
VAPTKGKARKSAAKAPRRFPAKKAAAESGTNKKAEVIAMMKRAKGATLAEMMEATGWQKHTVRGFVSILGSKRRAEDRVVEERCGGGQLPDCEVTIQAGSPPNAASGSGRGGVAALGRTRPCK